MPSGPRPPTRLVTAFEDLLQELTGVRPKLNTGAEGKRQRGAAHNILETCEGDYDLAVELLKMWIRQDEHRPMEKRQAVRYPSLLIVQRGREQLVYQLRVERSRQEQRRSVKGRDVPVSHPSLKGE